MQLAPIVVDRNQIAQRHTGSLGEDTGFCLCVDAGILQKRRIHGLFVLYRKLHIQFRLSDAACNGSKCSGKALRVKTKLQL